MAETLFILLGDALAWQLVSPTGELLRSGSADELASLAPDFSGEAVAVIPAAQALRTTAMVPSKQPRQIRQAVPYIVEEQLAMDVEDCAFALGGRTASGAVEVGVVSREQLQGWAESLRALEVEVLSLVSAGDLLPLDEGATILVDGATAIIRWGEGETLTLPSAHLPLAVGLLPVEVRSRGLTVYLAEEEAAAMEGQLAQLPGKPTVIKLQQTALLWCIGNYMQGGLAPPINYLQGEFRAPRRRRQALSPVWRTAAALAAVALLLHLASLLGQGLYLSNQAGQHLDEAKALYQAVFPQDRNVRDYRRRWRAHLGHLARDRGEFLSLFAQSALGLTEAGLALDSVNFNASRGDLVLWVRAASSEALVAYAQSLGNDSAQSKLEVEIGAIHQEAGLVSGSIRVRRGG